jgi:hypothetical protein
MTSDTKMSSLYYGNTYIYGGIFNFNNPQSSQKRQSDDSGLQIAKTKYKKVLLLERFFLPRPHVLEHNSAMKNIKTVNVCQIYLLFIVSQ